MKLSIRFNGTVLGELMIHTLAAACGYWQPHQRAVGCLYPALELPPPEAFGLEWDWKTPLGKGLLG